MNQSIFRWHLLQPNISLVDSIERETNFPSIVTRILVNRGVTSSEEAKRFLEPRLSYLDDPSLLSDVDKGARRLITAIRKQEKVCIYGDYDVDGICASCLIYEALKNIGVTSDLFIPHRITDGYGLNKDRLLEIIARGTKVIISVDCGTRSIEEAQLLKEHGVDLIVIDHHEPMDKLPDACALINPQRKDSKFPCRDLCAVGVAFLFVGALRREMVSHSMITKDRLDLRRFLDLVALGTIADVVPLLSDNRIFVAHGLRIINENLRPGIAALKAISGIAGKEVKVGHVAFIIAPRINAAGRVNDPMVSVKLLLAENPEEAGRYADILNRDNEERKRIEREVLKYTEELVLEKPNRKTIVVWGEGWHPGVIGIVAARLVECFHRPAVVIGIRENVGHGSARSISLFDIGSAISSLSDVLIKGGGHRLAAGLTIEVDKIQLFSESLEAIASRVLDDSALEPTIKIDSETTLREITDGNIINILQLLEPYGVGNPEPNFLISNVMVRESKRVGQKQNHLMMTLEQDGIMAKAVMWQTEFDVKPNTFIDIVCNVERDEKTQGIRLVIKDMRKI